MDDETLATLEHENMVATMSQIGDWFDGALVRHERGVTIVSAGLPVFLFNQVLVSGPDASDRPSTVAGPMWTVTSPS